MGGRDSKIDLNTDEAAAKMATLVGTLSKSHLKDLTVEAIREYRGAIETEERAFAVWQEAKTSSTTSDELHAKYVRIMLATRAQQLVVASLVDALGFIPEA